MTAVARTRSGSLFNYMKLQHYQSKSCRKFTFTFSMGTNWSVQFSSARSLRSSSFCLDATFHYPDKSLFYDRFVSFFFCIISFQFYWHGWRSRIGCLYQQSVKWVIVNDTNLLQIPTTKHNSAMFCFIHSLWSVRSYAHLSSYSFSSFVNSNQDQWSTDFNEGQSCRQLELSFGWLNSTEPSRHGPARKVLSRHGYGKLHFAINGK